MHKLEGDNTMPTKQEYNGYTNYETWLCALWLDNDQGQQGMMSDKASELAEEIDPHNADDVERVTQEMAEYIEQLVDDWRELFNLPNACLFTDFVNAGLREGD